MNDNITHAVLGMIGWIARYSVENWDVRKWSWGEIITKIIVSGFSGFMMYHVVMIMGQAPLAIFASGIGGFMGVWALEIMANLLKKKVW